MVPRLIGTIFVHLIEQAPEAALWNNHNAITCSSVLAVSHWHERADRVWFTGTCGLGCCLSLLLVCCYRAFDSWEGPIWCKRHLKCSLSLLWNDERAELMGIIFCSHQIKTELWVFFFETDFKKQCLVKLLDFHFSCFDYVKGKKSCFA